MNKTKTSYNPIQIKSASMLFCVLTWFFCSLLVTGCGPSPKKNGDLDDGGMDPDGMDISCTDENCTSHCRRFGYGEGRCVQEECVCGACPDVAAPQGAATVETLETGTTSELLRVTPPGGEEKDSILMLVLEGEPYTIGYQHGYMLADMIADVITHRYGCPEVSSEVLTWMGRAFNRMPDDFRVEIQGLADGLAAAGYDFDMDIIVMHATQAFAPPTGHFPWFNCPWDEPDPVDPDPDPDPDPNGSFSLGVWGAYTAQPGGILIGSPDWGEVPKSLARNRVIFSIRPAEGSRHVFLGVAGTIGLTGMNETGLSVAGTAGQMGRTATTTKPDNALPIHEGFMSLLMIARHALTHYSSYEEDPFGRFEDEVLSLNPMDGFIIQMSTANSSALWEPGGTASPDYPQNSRRKPADWDTGTLTPVDFLGDFVITQQGVFLESELEYQVEYYDGDDEPHGGTGVINGNPVNWRRWHLGHALVFSADPDREERFETWASMLNSNVPRAIPPVFTDGVPPQQDRLVSASPDGLGGFWTDGVTHGTWVRDSDTFSMLDETDTEICNGPLFVFPAGFTGWCNMGGNDMEIRAWSFDLPAGSELRLDGTNLSILPHLKSWTLTGYENGFYDRVPHSRTHMILNFLGHPQNALNLPAMYDVMQKAYLSIGGQDAPFGVGAYDLYSQHALITVSRYEMQEDNNVFIGGLNPEQIPVILGCNHLFGY